MGLVHEFWVTERETENPILSASCSMTIQFQHITRTKSAFTDQDGYARVYVEWEDTDGDPVKLKWEVKKEGYYSQHGETLNLNDVYHVALDHLSDGSSMLVLFLVIIIIIAVFMLRGGRKKK